MKSMMPGTTASQSCDSITSTTWLLASGWYFTRISPTTPTRTLRSTSFSGSASKVSTIFATSFAYGQYALPYNIFAVFDMPWLSSVSRTITFHRSYRRFAEPGFTSYGRTRYRHFMSRSPMTSDFAARCSNGTVGVKPGLSTKPCVEIAITGICG